LSTGAAMSFATAFNTHIKLGALISLSGFFYLTDLDEAREQVQNNPNSDTPLFIGHGEADSIVLPEVRYFLQSINFLG